MAPEIVVIGGGPAGSISAALLARNGARVRLLERAHFPRYHIGESVATSCRAIIELAGALEKVDARGYQVKEGLLLRWGAERDWVVDWPEIFGTGAQTSWQVDRADFDHVLLRHAASQGAEVTEGAQVKRVLFEDGRAVGVEWTHEGVTSITRADHVIDASGRAGVLSARHFRDRRQHDVFRNVAVWAYYKGGSLLPRTPRGGIDVISSPEGWYWVIPLADGMFSVGFVTHQDNFLRRRQDCPDVERLFLDFVQESDTVRELMADGEFQHDVRVEQDFSYAADSFCGPGYFLTGDSACFLDPLLSTGVHLAMYSGMLSAASILALHDGDVAEPEALSFYETLYRNAYARMFSMVAGFYEQYRGKATYFWLAQRLARGRYPELVRRPEPVPMRSAPDSEAFAALTAGALDLDDARRAGGADPLAAEVLAAQVAPRATARDRFDAATGLYLRTEPRLGIGRVTETART
ncbi:NAD(P)/FAD-dependent oxidoreductase [Streptomyces sp. GXMU-J15]|uniref:NAD(P)/FAD-dependent oxidoreductase n=2 Tax=Streptomyces TaxID=1883 RepID=A0ABT7ISD0_9ACTN|nr:NAD(P)/FAD-dependent oxidoreductase [Streptomyces fuscus]MDL2075486.1 NAD(P)/FAD-dependent oxidoreductase [Streptomyces fuscus]